jgi:UTP--glucose-1-phosphate uridylyltransferase
MKGVIVAAGYGTRFLPATKSVPKEMLPMFTKPLIDFILDEFEEAGIKEVVIITSRRKKTLDDYLDREVELETELEKAGKDVWIKAIQPRNMNFIFIRQQRMRGTGHALLITHPVIGDEPFVVAYPDDIVLGAPGVTKSMIDIFNKTGKSVLAVREEYNDVTRYGVILPENKDGRIYVRSIVEKPKKEDAPSNMVSIGRYLFSGEFLPLLEKQYADFTGTGEFFHIDTILKLAHDDKVLAYPVQGMMLDTGEPYSYFRSMLEYAWTMEEPRRILKEFYNEKYR